jgi:hypothetical protein
METPIPTPYDIIAPPGIPYSPSLIVWFLLLAGTVCVFIILTLALRRLRQTERKPVGSPAEQVRQLLIRCKERPDSTELASSLVRAVRRYLSLSELADVTAMAAFEMRSFSAKKRNPQLEHLVAALIETEQLRYRAAGRTDQTVLQRLHDAFDAYQASTEAR